MELRTEMCYVEICSEYIFCRNLVVGRVLVELRMNKDLLQIGLDCRAELTSVNRVTLGGIVLA